MVRPLCLCCSGSVRASSRPKAANCALVVHTFWPLSTHVPSSSWRARVCTAARSEPAAGSEKSWHQTSSPCSIGAEVAALLLLGAVGDDRRPEHADADDVEDAGHAGPRDLLADDDLLDRPLALAADVDRPGDAGEAALGELALPAPARVDVRVVLGSGARAARLGRLRLVLLQPGAHLLAVLGLLWGVVQVHACSFG